MPEPDFDDFELIPDTGETLSADEELSAFVDPDEIPLLTLDPGLASQAQGKTWLASFDPFEMAPNPPEVRGTAAVVMWAQVVVRTKALAHPIFPDSIGMDDPEHLIGQPDDAERRADYYADMRAALHENDHITNVSPARWEYNDDDELAVAILDLEIDGDETVQLAVPLQ